MKKFKVGDKVIVNGKRDGKTFVNERGTVRALSKWSDSVGVEFDKPDSKMFHDLEGNAKHYYGFWVYPFMCELVKDKKIVIYANGNDVVAVNKLTGEKGVAHCHPDDEFNFATGASIAFARLQGREPFEPVSNVTFRILAIKDYSVMKLTKGHIYEAIDGRITYDDGMVGGKYKSFEKYCKDNPRIAGHIVELKPGDDPTEILRDYERYNGKFVALETKNDFTKGKIYEVKDGYFENDKKSIFPMRYPIRDAEDLTAYFGSEPSDRGRYYELGIPHVIITE